MPKFVHVARILPGQTEAFLANVKNGFEMGAPALKALGLTRITSFHTPEADSGEGGLLFTIYEAGDASVIEALYGNPAVIAGEERNHGTLVTPHNHDAVSGEYAVFGAGLDGVEGSMAAAPSTPPWQV